METIVYLDQNKWIDLLKQRNDTLPDHYPDLSPVLTTVERTATRDDVLYPIDFVRLQETAARRRDTARDGLFGFMRDISDLWAFTHFIVAEQEEIKATVHHIEGRDHNLYSRILNRGVPHLIGGQNYALVDEDGNEVTGDNVDALMALLEGETTFDLTTTNDALIETLRETHSNTESSAPLLSNWGADDLQDEFGSTERARRAAVLRYFIHDIIPTYLSYGNERGIPIPDLLVDLGEYWRQGENAESVRFLRNFATAYCFAELQFRRDIDHSPIEGDDVRDLLALAVAIPYSDVVVCEKHFANLAQQASIDDAFDTVVTTNLTELPQHVAQ